MKTKLFVLGDAPLVSGFRLAGLENLQLTTTDGYERDLESVLTRSEFGIIITNEYFLATVGWRMKKRLDGMAYPVIVPIPDYSGKSSEGEQIRELIKRALGFDFAVNK